MGGAPEVEVEIRKITAGLLGFRKKHKGYVTPAFFLWVIRKGLAFVDQRKILIDIVNWRSGRDSINFIRY